MDCGLHLTKEVLNGKWKPALLNAISMDIKRPGDILRLLPGATRSLFWFCADDSQGLFTMHAHVLVSSTFLPGQNGFISETLRCYVIACLRYNTLK